MDINQLVYFVQLCQDKSFTKAANNLHISQQGLSMATIRLEKELGSKLFHRTHSGLTLTENGEFLKPRAESISNLFHECENYFDFSLERKHTLTIACVFDLMGTCPGFFQNVFQNSNTSLGIKIIEQTAIECENMVKNENAELGFVTGPIDSLKFKGDFLFQKRICAVVNQTHPLARFDSIDITQLNEEKILMMNQKFKVNHNLIQRCNDAGFVPNIVFQGDRMTLYNNMVKENPSFVGIITEFFAKEFSIPELKVIYFNDPTFVWSIFLISKADKPLSQVAQVYKKSALNYFRK